ncbi:DUF4232 domain-containing protein [Streptomyces sp. NPDC005279]|uniref:DUF4232 domain-containing protein n=1 Tax=Streptomyces sp. NPDC005279 TaxID=3364712 RepID=UPI003686CB0B
MRNARIRTTAVAATALLAALSLTACQSGDDGDADAKKSGAAAASASTPSTGAKPAPNPKNTPAGSDTRTGSGGRSTGGGNNSNSGGKSTGKAGDSGPVTAACIGENTKVTVSKVSRPINHLLLTMTNTGSKACNAYHAPLLRFDDAQAVTQIMDSSKPQAVVTIAPGESAYASLLLEADDSGENGQTVKKLTVHFAPRSGSGSTESAPDVLTLPAGTYADSNAAVSYWQSTMADALTY